MCIDLQMLTGFVQEVSFGATPRDVIRVLCMQCKTVETCPHVTDREFEQIQQEPDSNPFEKR